MIVGQGICRKGGEIEYTPDTEPVPAAARTIRPPACRASAEPAKCKRDEQNADTGSEPVGCALYEALEARLKAMGIRNLYACIGDPIREDEYLTRNSEQFHRHLGFTKVGEFHRCGYKFRRWYNMIWMEKIIGDHSSRESREKRET